MDRRRSFRSRKNDIHREIEHDWQDFSILAVFHHGRDNLRHIFEKLHAIFFEQQLICLFDGEALETEFLGDTDELSTRERMGQKFKFIPRIWIMPLTLATFNFSRFDLKHTERISKIL